jgi:hypothetical protein
MRSLAAFRRAPGSDFLSVWRFFSSLAAVPAACACFFGIQFGTPAWETGRGLEMQDDGVSGGESMCKKTSRPLG